MGKQLNLPGNITIDSDEFAKKSHDEQTAIIKEVFKAITEDPNINGVLFNPETGNRIFVDTVIGTPQEQQMIDVIIDSILKGNISASGISRDEIGTILQKIEDGTATPEEQNLARLFLTQANDDQEACMISQNLSSVICEMAEFVATQRHYDSKIADYYLSLLTIFTLDTVLTEGTVLNKYRHNPDAGDKVLDMIAEEIYKVCKDKMASMPDDLTMAMALTKLIVRLTKNHPFTYVSEIKDLFAEANGHNVEAEFINGPRPKNGSNDGTPSNVVRPNVFDKGSEDVKNAMRDE